MKIAVLILSFLAVSLLVTAQNEPFRNMTLSADERADDLLTRLTLEEKIGLMMDVSRPVERLDIPVYNWWNEALHGIGRAGLATVFPQAVGMAATFDDQLINRVFTAVSDEARAKFNDFRSNGKHGRYQGLTFWTPNINIFRDPRWGRGQETYGEDPYLTGQLGMAVVRGLQGPEDAKYDKLHACAKHYAVHSGPEWNRHSFDAKNISQRDLWETYLPAFKNLVVDAGVKEVMCAYNRFEGEPCCSNKQLLVSILREDWGYEGIVVSDCWAINDFYGANRHETHPDAKSASADAVLSGTDLECGSTYRTLSDAVKSGLITEQQIDVSVRRLLKARFELGELDPANAVPWSSIKYEVVNSKEHQALALETARKSITLLMNKNKLLPLQKDLKIAVMGPNATDSVMQWGNYEGTPGKTFTILEGIQKKIPGVLYEKGCDKIGTRVLESAFNKVKTPDGKSKGFAAQYWNNTDLSGEVAATQVVSNPFAFDNGGATVFAPGVNLTNFSARYKGVLQPDKDGEIIFTISGDDSFRVLVNNQKVIEYWGQRGEGKRDYTLSAKAGQAYEVVVEYMQGLQGATLKFDLGYEKPYDPTEAVAKVNDAQVIIFAGGISPRLEGEEMRVDYPGFKGGDRTDIELPAVQRELIQALKKAGKKVIFINCSGSAMGLAPEAEACDAILQAWYPGQAGGTAVADVIFGDYNPAGRLPVTFYKSADQLPDFEDYSMKGRTYRYLTEKPLFAFGHGLSYTTFKYGKATLAGKSIKAGQPTSLTLTLANTGKMDGDEVVQVYIRNLQDPEGPAKSLRAFRRIHLKAGEKQKVNIELPATTFEWFDAKTNKMSIQPGKYEILVGGTSDDQELKRLPVVLM